jgi:hypothetical protein
MYLFSGAIGLFKNPTYHRAVSYDDPVMASEVVLLLTRTLRTTRYSGQTDASGSPRRAGLVPPENPARAARPAENTTGFKYCHSASSPTGLMRPLSGMNGRSRQR